MKLAADANVLLSALIGGQAMRVLRHPVIAEIGFADDVQAGHPLGLTLRP